MKKSLLYYLLILTQITSFGRHKLKSLSLTFKTIICNYNQIKALEKLKKLGIVNNKTHILMQQQKLINRNKALQWEAGEEIRKRCPQYYSYSRYYPHYARMILFTSLSRHEAVSLLSAMGKIVELNPLLKRISK